MTFIYFGGTYESQILIFLLFRSHAPAPVRHTMPYTQCRPIHFGLVQLCVDHLNHIVSPTGPEWSEAPEQSNLSEYVISAERQTENE